MTVVNDTAHARPKVHSRANSHTPLTTQTSPSDLCEAILATNAIVQMFARGLSAQAAARRQNAPDHPWLLDRTAINGLSAALKIVGERTEALRRSTTEGRSV